MNSDRYYVYTHKFSNGVWYVGKGVRDRYKSTQNRSAFWWSLVRKYGPPELRKIVASVPEELAFLCEIECIDAFRRRGIALCNHTLGGEGISGYRCTDEQRRRTGEHRKAYMNRPEIRAKYAATTAAYMNRPEVKAKMAQRAVENSKDPAFRAMRSAVAKEVSNRPDMRKFRGEVFRAYVEQHGHPSLDPTVYTFKRKTGEVFVGTRKELRTAYPEVSVSGLSMLLKGKLKSTAKWSIHKE